MVIKETYTLSNGVTIPKVAFGTWQIENDDARRCVKQALNIGYTHVDTAAAYENEQGVGQGIKDSNVNREDIFITSKIPAEIKTYEGAVESINKTLEYLDIDQIDLMLIHAPRPWAEMFPPQGNMYYEENAQVWKALEEAYEAGKVKAIGVSNFQIEDIQNIFDNCKIKPMVNQIQVHVGNVPKELIDFCKDNDMVVMAYAPNATGGLINNDEIKKIADKYGVSTPQICIRFDLQLGLIPLPKTVHEEYMKVNADIDFEISDEDMDKLLAI